MTLTIKNYRFNEFVVIDLVENEVLHNKSGFLFKKLEITLISKWAAGRHLEF